MRTFSIALGGVVCLFALARAHATITSVAPFVGAYTETWESFPSYGDPNNPTYLPSPTDIMGGFASIANTQMLVYEKAPGASFFGLGSNGDAQVSDGVKGMGLDSGDAEATIKFDAPISSFGAYWGAADGFGYTDDITLSFSDGSSTTFNYDPSPPASGNLVWRGWSSSVGITSITYSGDYVAIDGLQAVPEPAMLSLSALSTLLMLRRR